MKLLIYKLTHPFVRFYWRFFKPVTFGAKALVIYEDKILLVKNINGKCWSLPGGKIDLGESPEVCIQRELYEELGLSIKNIDYCLGKYFSEKEGKKDTIYIYIITASTSKFERQWELAEAQWFELDNLPRDISPATQKRINEYLGGQRNISHEW